MFEWSPNPISTVMVYEMVGSLFIFCIGGIFLLLILKNFILRTVRMWLSLSLGHSSVLSPAVTHFQIPSLSLASFLLSTSPLQAFNKTNEPRKLSFPNTLSFQERYLHWHWEWWDVAGEGRSRRRADSSPFCKLPYKIGRGREGFRLLITSVLLDMINSSPVIYFLHSNYLISLKYLYGCPLTNLHQPSQGSSFLYNLGLAISVNY